MENKKLNDYIKKCLEIGKTEEEIKNNLLDVGWKKEDVEEALLSVKESESISIPETINEEFISEEVVDNFKESLKDEINSIQEDNKILENKEDNDPTEIIKEEPVHQEKIKSEFVEKPKQINIKKIIITIVIAIIIFAIIGTVVAFIKKIGPFSPLEKEYEQSLENEDIPIQQEEEPEVIIEWICGDEIIDDRDGKSYSTLRLGSQCWTIDNLNYSTENSFCYNNDIESCETYGRLYNWSDAITACPSGWVLPTDYDFKLVERYLEMEKEKVDINGWREMLSNVQGILNIKLSGSRDKSGEFKYLGEYTNLWTADSIEDDLHFARSFRMEDSSIYRGSVSGDYGYSVRCIKL
ncbi:MAG: FISUMP domain-containing protein [Candidatus Pacebacteria bacterium]|nr:FISUMP domain-containing protein [Candidatus Paceibacterota bacterium]MDD4073957.1 FISUMP domain-containing protein [Candidatus Paceibacterota bacterium]